MNPRIQSPADDKCAECPPEWRKDVFHRRLKLNLCASVSLWLRARGASLITTSLAKLTNEILSVSSVKSVVNFQFRFFRGLRSLASLRFPRLGVSLSPLHCNV
jgi:hypothetical protein